MIQHLKLRFIIVFMSLLTLVLVGIIGGIYILMLRSEAEQSNMILQSVIRGINPLDDFKSDQSVDIAPDSADKTESARPYRIVPAQPGKIVPDPTDKIESTQSDAFFPPGRPPRGIDPRNNNMFRNTITLRFSSTHEIQGIHFSFGEEITDKRAILSVAEEILEKNAQSGIVNAAGIQYRYLLVTRQNGKIIGLLDRSIEIVTLNRLFVTLITIGVISFVVFLVLSILLSGWAIRPIAQAWEQQRNFVADASHELKTPLTIMNTNIDVVLANPEDTVKNQSKWLLYSKAEGARMSKLVTGLLYLAKADIEKERLVHSNLNISDIINGVCLAFESYVYEKGKILETDITPGLTIFGDEDKIKQLVGILLDNAVTHSDENGRITLTVKADPKKKVRLTVSNTGDPIPGEHISKIFQRFYRPDESRARNTGGFGLGLSIAKAIVSQHKGTISVSSKPNETRFTIRLLQISSV